MIAPLVPSVSRAAGAVTAAAGDGPTRRPSTRGFPTGDSNLFDSLYANRFESIRFVKKIGLSIHYSCHAVFALNK